MTRFLDEATGATGFGGLGGRRSWARRRVQSALVALAALASVAAACSWGAAPVAAQTSLAWRFQRGQTLRYALSCETTNKGRDTGATTTILATDVALSVDAVDRQGAATITQRIERFRMRLILADGRKAEFDTAAGEAPEGLMKYLAAGLTTTVGKPVTYRMSPRGEIGQLKLPPELAKMVGDPTMAANQAMELLTPEGIQQMTGVALLPERPVMQDARWTGTLAVQNAVLGAQKIETAYDYRGPTGGDRRLEQIATRSTTTPTPAPKQIVQVRIKSQKTEGTVLFDAAAGCVVESETKTKMDLSVSFSNNQVAQQMESIRTARLRESADAAPATQR